MARAVKCFTGSLCGMDAIALGLVMMEGLSEQRVDVPADQDALFKLLVRSRDEESYRVTVEDGVIRWLDEAADVREGAEADGEVIAMVQEKIFEDASDEPAVIFAREVLNGWGCRVRNTLGGRLCQVTRLHGVYRFKFIRVHQQGECRVTSSGVGRRSASCDLPVSSGLQVAGDSTELNPIIQETQDQFSAAVPSGMEIASTPELALRMHRAWRVSQALRRAEDTRRERVMRWVETFGVVDASGLNQPSVGSNRTEDIRASAVQWLKNRTEEPVESHLLEEGVVVVEDKDEDELWMLLLRGEIQPPKKWRRAIIEAKVKKEIRLLLQEEADVWKPVANIGRRPF